MKKIFLLILISSFAIAEELPPLKEVVGQNKEQQQQPQPVQNQNESNQSKNQQSSPEKAVINPPNDNIPKENIEKSIFEPKENTVGYIQTEKGEKYIILESPDGTKLIKVKENPKQLLNKEMKKR
ncbi:hypothetical protein JCM14244_04270 [Venenivibrio stagnispumantis]|uniref:Uncharacterized protein n=1 Tax=Venenivibrio stagnispumantis TaxID=407998 RepID=A0AA45WJV2_9AQUI|nr:hypothetical protein [Venenivibrio stagnispumantis]MCW4572935.1 hypothetical protein [Venenivibrio stagnispumantis]SMP04756.1 hypothetical protein SAMN06264868_10336 [Venenivibrio stagnispumantis]